MGKILSTEDLQRLVAEAVSQGKDRLVLHDAHFSEINLRLKEVPISLDLDGAIIDGDFIITMALFGGSYISLDRAHIKGVFCTSGLEVTERQFEGIGIFLRRAKIHGEIILYGTKINTLSLGGAQFLPGEDGKLPTGLIRLDGAQINRLFLYLDPGEAEEYDRQDELARLKRAEEEGFPSAPE